jgi:hypothetical protein
MSPVIKLIKSPSEPFEINILEFSREVGGGGDKGN